MISRRKADPSHPTFSLDQLLPHPRPVYIQFSPGHSRAAKAQRTDANGQVAKSHRTSFRLPAHCSSRERGFLETRVELAVLMQCFRTQQHSQTPLATDTFRVGPRHNLPWQAGCTGHDTPYTTLGTGRRPARAQPHTADQACQRQSTANRPHTGPEASGSRFARSYRETRTEAPHID